MELNIHCPSYFDGQRFHTDGPYVIRVRDGRIASIASAAVDDAPAAGPRLDVGFAMPGLVETHAHLFLDGDELDFERRKQHLSAPRETFLATARRNLEASVACGITLIRDAGDIHGINTAIRAWTQNDSGADHPDAPRHMPLVRSAGRALRRSKRYGSFMAIEASGLDDIPARVAELLPDADDLKLLLTGIIDFENGQMKGGVQFDEAETRRMVELAHAAGKLTFAHCSGPDGLAIATAAGIDSIEHGFFMEERFLDVMAAQGLAWTPTFAPVAFQHDRPELANWSTATVGRLRAILDQHRRMVLEADRMGIALLTGSDAGSYGVPHGTGLIDELLHLHAAGLPMQRVLAAATSTPRRLWGYAPADLRPGCRAELACLADSPLTNPQALRQVEAVVIRGQLAWQPAPVAAY